MTVEDILTVTSIGTGGQVVYEVKLKNGVICGVPKSYQNKDYLVVQQWLEQNP